MFSPKLSVETQRSESASICDSGCVASFPDAGSLPLFSVFEIIKLVCVCVCCPGPAPRPARLGANPSRLPALRQDSDSYRSTPRGRWAPERLGLGARAKVYYRCKENARWNRGGTAALLLPPRLPLLPGYCCCCCCCHRSCYCSPDAGRPA